jgi:multiple sugar transport system ATP-binding protein
MNQGVLQQLGTPREVYDQPANLFVAGFMGSPPMNFIHGSIDNRRFQSAGVDLPVSDAGSSGAAVLGFRPEDARIADAGQGLFDGRVFAAELTGEYTLVTVLLGEAGLGVKMPRDYDIAYDSTVAVGFPPERGFVFDAGSGERTAVKLAATS